MVCLPRQRSRILPLASWGQQRVYLAATLANLSKPILQHHERLV